MFTIEKIDLETVDSSKREVWEKLTKEKFRCCLYGKDPYGILNSQFSIWGATVDGQPVGLLIGSLFPITHTSEIYSLFVKEEWRNHGIATQLLAKVEQAAIAAKCITIIHKYNVIDTTTPALEQAFQNNQWKPSYLFMIVLHFDAYDFFPVWEQKQFSHAEGFTEFPWKDLTEEERNTLKHQEKQYRFSASVSPFREEHMMDSTNSLGLRYNGEVVGWMVTHRIKPDTIRYSALYIDNAFQFQGHAIKLLIDSIELQRISRVRWACLELNLGQVESSWRRFVERRLVPFTDKVIQIKCGWKDLTQKQQ